MADRRLDVSCEFVFDRLAEAGVSQAFGVLVPERRRATAVGSGTHGKVQVMTVAAIDARVSSSRQREEHHDRVADRGVGRVRRAAGA